ALVVSARMAAADAPRAADESAAPRVAAATEESPAAEAHIALVPVEVKPHISGKRRALAIAAAVIPGFVVRGMGSWLVGEKRAAKRLATGAVGGLLLAGAMGGLVGVSNGSPYTIPAIPFVLTGTGALLTTWAEDIWIAAGGNQLDTGPLRDPTW